VVKIFKKYQKENSLKIHEIEEDTSTVIKFEGMLDFHCKFCFCILKVEVMDNKGS